MPKFRTLERVWITDGHGDPVDGYIVAYDKHATRPYTVRVTGTDDVYYCCEFQISKREAQQAKKKKREPSIAKEIKEQAEQLADQKIEKFKQKEVAKMNEKDFDNIYTSIASICRVEDSAEEMTKELQVVIQMAKDYVKSKVVGEK